MTAIILGGGFAGLTLAHFLNQKSIILEKEKRAGGLCRSFDLNGIKYDIGPHILFSKNPETLKKLTSFAETHQIKRSNRIFHQGKYVKYPFENDLASLGEKDAEYCLKEFMNNPYEDYDPKNMLQFFLKTFGEGITRLYLQPYNEKIWKFDPAFLDLQMVGRIPKPPKEDVIKSARGTPTEGYKHQLFFNYPTKGGVQSLVEGVKEKIKDKAVIRNDIEIKKIRKEGDMWHVETNQETFSSKTIINCMPLHELFKYIDAPEEVTNTLQQMKYNSIHIIIVQLKKDNIGDNFSMTLADKNLIFHRLSKLNFLGENYQLGGDKSTLLVEVTFRPDSYLSTLSHEDIKNRVVSDLAKIKLIDSPDDVIDTEVRTFKYAYVIYDLDHRKNTDFVLNYLNSEGMPCCGRFAEFEYINTDKVLERSMALAERLNNGEKEN